MQILDLSEPTSPALVGTVANQAAGIVVEDSLVYLLWPNLYTVSIATPQNPVVLDTAFLTGGVAGMMGATVPGYLYWAGGGKVGCVNVVDPNNVRPLGDFYGASQRMSCIVGQGENVLAGEYLFGLWILRRNPVVSISTDGAAWSAHSSCLFQNSPNPCNASTVIRFELPRKEEIRLALYGVLGELIQILAEGVFEPGMHAVQADLSGLPSAVYFYRMEARGSSQVRKLLVLR
jgi:hypothetical protein